MLLDGCDFGLFVFTGLSFTARLEPGNAATAGRAIVLNFFVTMCGVGEDRAEESIALPLLEAMEGAEYPVCEISVIVPARKPWSLRLITWISGYPLRDSYGWGISPPKETFRRSKSPGDSPVRPKGALGLRGLGHGPKGTGEFPLSGKLTC